ncbi:hypothetical protein KJ644_03275 [Candidatus Dependentiae bacterium]|nr:hypothetical protein [Candidatus Dependentiae bacterium]MBU4387468.1 hypothetical protein [Candidatus Dependentiae bacterium]MCG2756151.1 hypothetical protein [Candidatus Dependentiae bacterium]
MQKQDVNKSNVFIKKEDEQILVIKREILFAHEEISGIKKIDFNYYQNLIEKNKEFIWRSLAETDKNYKQIIPYLIFNFQDKYFLMQRQSKASEVRLQNMYSLGIGGHIRQEDINGFDIFSWARREFYEEVDFKGNFEIEPIGLLNDDSNDVGQVHAGFVFLLHGDSANIRVHSELKSGKLLTLDECKQLYDSMENWSKLVFDFLNQR